MTLQASSRCIHNTTPLYIRQEHKDTTKEQPPAGTKHPAAQPKQEMQAAEDNDTRLTLSQSEHIKSGVDEDIFKISNIAFVRSQSGPEEAVRRGNDEASSSNPLQWSLANQELSIAVDEIHVSRGDTKERSRMKTLQKKEKNKTIHYVDVSRNGPI